MSAKPWPLRLAVREGLATARTGRWTSLLIAAAVTWLVAAPGAADAVIVSQLMDAERAWIDAGAYVYVVTGAPVDGGQNPIPTAACEGLAGYQGIEGAFALKRADVTGTFAHIPGGRVSLYPVSSGALTFLDADPAQGGVVLATGGLLERSGVVDGDLVTVVERAATNTVTATSDPLTVRAVDTASIGDEFDGAMLVPAALPDQADVCYVRTDAAHRSAVEASLASLLAFNGQAAVVSPRLFQSEFTVDYANAFQDRALRWPWIPTGALMALLWGLVQWFRRSQMAIYATFGMPPAARLTMQVTEWSLLAGFGAAWGWGIGVTGAIALGARPWQALGLVTVHAVLALASATALVVLMGLRPAGSLLAALKDR